MLEEFLKELTELSNKYKLTLFNCGCCGASIYPLELGEVVTGYTVGVRDGTYRELDAVIERNNN